MDKFFCIIGILFGIVGIVLYIQVYKHFNKFKKDWETKVLDYNIAKKVKLLLTCIVIAWLFNIISFIIYLVKTM